MKVLIVDKIYSKEIPYKKNGRDLTFTKYAVQSGGTWYTLDGKGKENIKQGDKIKGQHFTKDWQSGDKSGTENILKLLDPEILELYERVERLENLIKNVNKQPFPDKSNSPIGDEENEDLPF